MASDVLFDECAVDKFDINGDIFMTGGIMNPKELYLTDLVCSKDASSSDSGISTFDDIQDIANVTDLNSLMDADLKDLDFGLDFSLPKIDQEDGFDPGFLIKKEPSSPSPTLSSESGDGYCPQQPVSPDYYGYHNEVNIKAETNSPLILPTYHQQQYDPTDSLLLRSPNAYSPQQSYVIEPLHSSASTSSSPTHHPLSGTSSSSSPTSSQPPLSLESSLPAATSAIPQLLPYVHQQPSFQQHNDPLDTITSPYSSPHSATSSPSSQHSYIVVPNIKTEPTPTPVPIIPAQSSSVVQVGGSEVKPIAAVNINAILNSKIKIQPKPGSEVVSVSHTAGVQWVSSTTSQVPFTAQPISIISTPSIVSGGGITSIADEKTLKRAQRIIKNRESASLSRKRKKEYLTSLEERLQQCRDENERLSRDNETLRRQVDFLQRENLDLKNPNGMSPAKKICLMCIALLLTLNLSPFSFLGDPSATTSQSSMGISHHGSGRHLLSLPNDMIVQMSGYKGGMGMKDDNWARTGDVSLLMQFDEELNLLAQRMNITKKLVNNMCPMYFNSTESVRLAEQLRGWMISQEEEKKRNKEKKRQKKKKDYPTLRRFGTNFSGYAQSVPNSEVNGPTVNSNNYPIQVFNGGFDSRQDLLNAIPRRNDTFYVLSFSTDYFLVPATAHNKTMRPRMSLLMPVVTPSINESTGQPEDSVGMMQIDCEILNTNLIHVHRSAFPHKTPFNSTAYDSNNNTDTRQENQSRTTSRSHGGNTRNNTGRSHNANHTRHIHSHGRNFNNSHNDQNFNASHNIKSNAERHQQKQERYWEKLRKSTQV